MTTRPLSLLLVLLVCGATSASAQTDTQDVTVVVQEVNEIVVSGNVSITLNSLDGGGDYNDVTDASTTYDLTTNGTNKKITAVLGAEYATGISLAVLLGAPTGATAAGSAQTLNASTATDLVTGISNSGSGLSISYTASATSAAATNGAGETQTVTFTVTD